MAWIYFALLLLLLCLSAFLWKSGELLVHADPPGRVRWAAVLSGEGRDMELSESAWGLYQEGLFDSLILMGPRVFKSRYASEFAAGHLETRGFPGDHLFQLRNEALSTLEEAAILIPQARLLGADTLLIITAGFRSARTARIYRKLAGGYPVIRVYAAEAFAFDPRAWWSFGESREIWLIEWISTLRTGWRLLRQKPLVGSAEFVLLEPNPRPGGVPPDSAGMPALEPAASLPAKIDGSPSGPVDTSAHPADTTGGLQPAAAAGAGDSTAKMEKTKARDSANPEVPGDSGNRSPSKSNTKKN